MIDLILEAGGQYFRFGFSALAFIWVWVWFARSATSMQILNKHACVLVCSLSLCVLTSFLPGNSGITKLESVAPSHPDIEIYHSYLKSRDLTRAYELNAKWEYPVQNDELLSLKDEVLKTNDNDVLSAFEDLTEFEIVCRSEFKQVQASVIRSGVES